MLETSEEYNSELCCNHPVCRKNVKEANPRNDLFYNSTKTHCLEVHQGDLFCLPLCHICLCIISFFLSFSINMLLIKHLIVLVFTAQWLICSNGLESKCYTISLLSFTSHC